MKATFYEDSLYGKELSLVGNKLAQVLPSRDFLFVVPMKSKSNGLIGLRDICDEHVIPSYLIYNNAKDESMTGTMLQKYWVT